MLLSAVALRQTNRRDVLITIISRNLESDAARSAAAAGFASPFTASGFEPSQRDIELAEVTGETVPGESLSGPRPALGGQLTTQAMVGADLFEFCT